MKRLISILLSCLMISGAICCTGISAFASTAFSYKNFDYVLAGEDSAVICGYTGNDKVVEIPDKLLGKKIVAIDKNTFAHNTSVTGVSFERAEYLRSIGDHAFVGCTSLESVKLNSSITTLGQSVFQGCTGLVSVDLGTTIREIPSQAFYNCTSLKEVEIKDNVSTIGYLAFGRCTSLEKATVTFMVTSLNHSFDDCGKQLVMYGYKNTVAESYAFDNKIRFVALNRTKDYDINCDGDVNVRDVTTMQRYLVLLDDYDKNDIETVLKLDINEDNKFNIRDVTCLQKLLAGVSII